ncbi:PAS domain-containing sensor histidine kinase [Candidatus Saccharibacteria bacterium]|nr:PAS domain-containing sensor histidine kinase [Candidatus Saccharibacteria bacterium]
MTFWKKKSDKTEPVAPAPQQDTPNPERNNMNELVLQSIHEGVVFVGPEGNVHLANPVASELLGRNYDEIIGLNYESVFVLLDKTGAHVDTAHNPIAKALQQPEFSETRDLDLVTKGSEKRTPISLTIAPTTATDGRHSLVITFRDIEKELAEEHERNEFISTASHEMRTPVASIEGYLGLALNPATATIDERARDYLTKAHESSQHLGRLFQDLLDTTKLDDGQIAPKMEAVEIVSLVKNIADAQTPNIAAKGLGYQFGNDSGEQSMSGGRRLDQLIYASVDPDFMREIMNNIIENAIKYTPAGWITINIRADQYNVQISVSDTGIGIAREELKHIFQKFYRVDNRDTREIGGTGLGLYLVKQRIEAMNGRIWAESELGKGSRFTVMLPRISQKEFEQRNFLQQNLAKQGQMPQQAL